MVGKVSCAKGAALVGEQDIDDQTNTFGRYRFYAYILSFDSILRRTCQNGIPSTCLTVIKRAI